MKKPLCVRVVRFGRVIPILVAGSSLASCEGKVRPFARGTADAGVAAPAMAPGAMPAAPANLDSGGAGSPEQGEMPPAIDALDPNSTTAGQSGTPVGPSTVSDAGITAPVCVPSGPRDCSSELDNDCDGQPDNVVDDVCRCSPGAVEACDEHPGFDGFGLCKPGTRTCIVAGDAGSGASDWSACGGALGPGAADSCAIDGDDTDCDGIPNEGCTCVDGTTQQCGSSTDVGFCTFGTSTCVNGAFGQCVGAVPPAPRDSCVPGDDSNCNGIPNEGCTCINGETRPCGPPTVGICRAGVQTCVNGAFGAECVGAVLGTGRNCGSAADNDCDGRPDNTLDNVCECIPGQGNGPCSSDPNNSRCNAQGQCVACQTDSDCSLVTGRIACVGGVCSAPLLPNGADCTSGLQCSDGNCELWFRDEDGDGYGNQGLPRRTCGNTAPAGFVADSADCCDSDPDAKPGQEEFFNVPRVGCGGFDYNCLEGNETAPYSEFLTQCESLTFPNCDGKIWSSNGVSGVRPPDCGQAGGATFCGAFNDACTAISGGEVISSCH